MNVSSILPDEITRMRALQLEQCVKLWGLIEARGTKNNEFVATVRSLVLADLFYLLVRVCGRKDMLHPWVYARCREVEANPDEHIDLWSREHFKSSIITFGLTISDILRDPDVTFGIFSHTRPIAKAFLRQIMREFEGNTTLHQTFPDVLYGKDLKASPKWSEDDGIIVKRKSNPKEATIEAWGLVDGQPTSKHYKKLLYDDVVVKDSVTTPEMIEKTMISLEQSYSLGVTPGGKRRFAGTRWHFNDAYSTVIKRGTAKLRFHPGREGGFPDGRSVYWPEQTHIDKRRDMGEYTYSAQILLNPKADSLQGFKRDWLRFFKNAPPLSRTNNYVLVDAASSKKRGSDYTAIWLVQLGYDGNYYCTPVVRDRLNLTERADRVFKAKRDYQPMQIRYEKYGLMADIEHMQARMEKEHYRFEIIEVGGITSKSDRIKRLTPLFEQHRIYLPQTHHVTDWQANVRDLTYDFVEEEYAAFPVGLHDDLLDSLARICEPDLQLVWPKEEKPEYEPVPVYAGGNSAVAWMT